MNLIKVTDTKNKIVVNKTDNTIKVIQRPNKIIVKDVGIQGAKGDKGDAGGGTPYIEIPIGAVNGLNTNFTLSFLPITNTLQVFVGMGAVFKDRDFSLNTQIITFFTPPFLGEIITTIYNY